MKQTGRSPALQMVPLLFVCLAVHAVVRPFATPDSTPAQAVVWGQIISAAAVCALLSAFFHRVDDMSLQLLRAGGVPQAKAVLFLFAAAVSLAGGASLVTTEQFYRYVSDEPTLSLITAALVLLAASCAAGRGALTLTRTGGIVCALFLMSAILLAASSFHSARLENLVYSQAVAEQAVRRVAFGTLFPAELLCFLLMKIPMRRGGSRSICLSIAGAALFFSAAAVLAELVLGDRAGTMMQPLHTLARLGGLSVFKRFDALHVGVWLLALLLKQAFLLCGARTAVRGLLTERWAFLCIPCAVAATVAGAFVCSALPQGAAEILVSGATAAALGAALLFAYVAEVKS